MSQKSRPSYSIVKEPVEQTKFYSLYNVTDKQTGEVWQARVVHTQAIESLGLMQHVDYNEQALLNLKEKTHIIYVKQVFWRNEDMYFIQEKHKLRLSDHLVQKGRLISLEVVRIIQDVYQGICDIYQERYVHRNIRSEHIVLTPKNSQQPEMWKIQTLVPNNQEFSVECPFTWKRSTASPEEKEKQGQLDDDVLDAQIVWNFGFLAAHLLMGTDFITKNIKTDADIPWAKIKQLTARSKDLYQLIDRCLRIKLKERITLRKFFELSIFQESDRKDMSQYFQTASKMFKVKLASSIQKSVNMKSVNLKSQSLDSSIAPKKAVAFQNIQQAVEDNEEQDEFNAVRGNFLLYVNKYVHLVLSQPQSKQKQNREIIEYYFVKLGLRYLQVSKSQMKAKDKQKHYSSKIENQSTVIKRIKPEDNPLLKKFNINPKQNYELGRLIQIFNKLCGFAYSRLRQECEVDSNPDKMKAMAYFGFLGYLINTNNWESIRGFLPNRFKVPSTQFFERYSAEQATKMTQAILKQHFTTVQ